MTQSAGPPIGSHARLAAAMSEGFCTCGGRLDSATVERWFNPPGYDVMRGQCLSCKWVVTVVLDTPEEGFPPQYVT